MLRDIMESEVFPVVRLTRIFRQAMNSRIIMSAHRVNAGQFPDCSGGRHTDFYFMEEEDPEKAAQAIAALVRTKTSPLLPGALLRHSGADAHAAGRDRRGQSEPGSSGGAESRSGRTSAGAAIVSVRGTVSMQIRNNYDKEVFNGDIGTVETVSPGGNGR